MGGSMARMTVLLSAYACEPNKGSEPGVGWHWAREIAALGHEVWVVTRENNRESIEQELARSPQPNMQFLYFDLPVWARWWKKGNRGVHLYYYLWQLGAAHLVRRQMRSTRFDIVHHITFGVFRHPSFMAFFGVPFIFGPVGGGERAPFILRRSFPAAGYAKDLLRDIANWLVRLDPLMWGVFARSSLILCKTHETLAWIPRRFHHKCRVQLEIGIPEAPVPLPRQEKGGFRTLYVGRLIYLKAMHLGLRSFAELVMVQPNARLTIIGGGPEEPRLRLLAKELQIESNVEWISWLPRAEVMGYYENYDAFLFPSLHDSSGNVVLESLSKGLPVVCFDLGGPAVIADSSCGYIVSTVGKDEEGAVRGMADALIQLASDPEKQRRLAEGALTRARAFRWANVVASVYTGDIGDSINHASRR